MRLLAIVARIASPSAPPTCWEVLISPEASPASLWFGSAHRGDRDRHEREPEADRGQQRRAEDVAVEVPPCAGTCANHSRPPAINSIPTISGILKPNGDQLRGDAGRR